MFWYVGPWIWDASAMPGGSWRPPTGCDSLDLRPLPLQSVKGGTPGMGLFFGNVSRSQLENRPDYRLLGNGNWNDIKPTGVDRAAIPRRSGYTPKGDDLVGIVYDLMTDGADPDGLDGPKPLIPTTTGLVELRCGQRHAERFRFGRSGHTAMVRQSLRKEFSKLFTDAKAGRLKDAEHHRRILDFWCEKYGVDDWKEFVPTALQTEVPGRLKHETTITDNFNRADSSSVGTSSEGWSWTEVSADMDINGNKCRNRSGDANSRADSDLSSADHYAQAALSVSSGNGNHGVCTRHSSSARNYYLWMNQGSSSRWALYKVSSGAFTLLGSQSTGWANPAGEVHKLTSNGSSQEGFVSGSSKLSLSDSSITGNTRTGLNGFATDTLFYDDFEAADLGGGGGGIIYTQLERGLRGYARGLYEGRP